MVPFRTALVCLMPVAAPVFTDGDEAATATAAVPARTASTSTIVLFTTTASSDGLVLGVISRGGRRSCGETRDVAQLIGGAKEPTPNESTHAPPGSWRSIASARALTYRGTYCPVLPGPNLGGNVPSL